MKKMDYILSDGTVINVETTKASIPDIDVSKLSGKELEDYCVRLFTDFGWNVKLEGNVHVETGQVRADLVLGDGSRDYGYVEIVKTDDIVTAIEKKNSLMCIIDTCKPDICVLTNGIVFDVFYKGVYSGTKSTPPTMDDIKRTNRLLAYQTAFMKMKEESDE